jgi:hypothetical protein
MSVEPSNKWKTYCKRRAMRHDSEETEDASVF